MLNIDTRRLGPRHAGMARRDFLRVGALGSLGLTLADWLKLKAHGATTEGKAKSVIQLWMWGGPTHLDTFDPKPEAGQEYCGALKNPIATNVPGIRISELLPLMAKQADKYSILRGFSSQSGGHYQGTYMVQTGMPTRTQFGRADRAASNELPYPSIGSVVALKKGRLAIKGPCRRTSFFPVAHGGSVRRDSWARGTRLMPPAATRTKKDTWLRA